jgi:hypothetical protein
MGIGGYFNEGGIDKDRSADGVALKSRAVVRQSRHLLLAMVDSRR